MQTVPGRIINPSLKTVAVRHYMRRAKKEQIRREQFLNLPEGTPCQLIAGRIIMHDSCTALHQNILGRMYISFLEFIRAKKAGRLFIAPLDVFFNNQNIFQPDILFIRKDNLSIIGEKMIEGVPDLVVEVLSPSSVYHDLWTKFKVYEQSGVREYWIVDLERKSVEVFSNSGKKFQLRQEVEGKGAAKSVVLSGFSVALEELF